MEIEKIIKNEKKTSKEKKIKVPTITVIKCFKCGKDANIPVDVPVDIFPTAWECADNIWDPSAPRMCGIFIDESKTDFIEIDEEDQFSELESELQYLYNFSLDPIIEENSIFFDCQYDQCIDELNRRLKLCAVTRHKCSSTKAFKRLYDECLSLIVFLYRTPFENDIVNTTKRKIKNETTNGKCLVVPNGLKQITYSNLEDVTSSDDSRMEIDEDYDPLTSISAVKSLYQPRKLKKETKKQIEEANEFNNSLMLKRFEVHVQNLIIECDELKSIFIQPKIRLYTITEQIHREFYTLVKNEAEIDFRMINCNLSDITQDFEFINVTIMKSLILFVIKYDVSLKSHVDLMTVLQKNYTEQMSLISNFVLGVKNPCDVIFAYDKIKILWLHAIDNYTNMPESDLSSPSHGDINGNENNMIDDDDEGDEEHIKKLNKFDILENTKQITICSKCYLRRIVPVILNTQWVQCDDCGKWRKIPGNVDISKLPEKWSCTDNEWNPTRANHDVPEDEDNWECKDIDKKCNIDNVRVSQVFIIELKTKINNGYQELLDESNQAKASYHRLSLSITNTVNSIETIKKSISEVKFCQSNLQIETGSSIALVSNHFQLVFMEKRNNLVFKLENNKKILEEKQILYKLFQTPPESAKDTYKQYKNQLFKSDIKQILIDGHELQKLRKHVREQQTKVDNMKSKVIDIDLKYNLMREKDALELKMKNSKDIDPALAEFSRHLQSGSDRLKEIKSMLKKMTVRPADLEVEQLKLGDLKNKGRVLTKKKTMMEEEISNLETQISNLTNELGGLIKHAENEEITIRNSGSNPSFLNQQLEIIGKTLEDKLREMIDEKIKLHEYEDKLKKDIEKKGNKLISFEERKKQYESTMFGNEEQQIKMLTEIETTLTSNYNKFIENEIEENEEYMFEYLLQIIDLLTMRTKEGDRTKKTEIEEKISSSILVFYTAIKSAELKKNIDKLSFKDIVMKYVSTRAHNLSSLIDEYNLLAKIYWDNFKLSKKEEYDLIFDDANNEKQKVQMLENLNSFLYRDIINSDFDFYEKKLNDLLDEVSMEQATKNIQQMMEIENKSNDNRLELGTKSGIKFNNFREKIGSKLFAKLIIIVRDIELKCKKEENVDFTRQFTNKIKVYQNRFMKLREGQYVKKFFETVSKPDVVSSIDIDLQFIQPKKTEYDGKIIKFREMLLLLMKDFENDIDHHFNRLSIQPQRLGEFEELRFNWESVYAIFSDENRDKIDSNFYMIQQIYKNDPMMNDKIINEFLPTLFSRVLQRLYLKFQIDLTGKRISVLENSIIERLEAFLQSRVDDNTIKKWGNEDIEKYITKEYESDFAKIQKTIVLLQQSRHEMEPAEYLYENKIRYLVNKFKAIRDELVTKNKEDEKLIAKKKQRIS